MPQPDFLIINKIQLMRIFSEIYAGNQIELEIRGNPKEFQKEFDKKCCLETINVFKYMDGQVEFPINCDGSTDDDNKLSEDLLSIICCEEGVRSGVLARNGEKYRLLSYSDTDKNIYGKYLDFVK